ncbi:cyclic pyranopterin monophosphate synthase MoaC [Pseudoflavonifractor sp. 60]|uniref:cyclic pyranopterin monophosphate synthase MoaC n=1 Tax=Pseudoflavonifractor sp. 60 TaxID=2304576 RepID=UPI00136A8064|nr:cyclic pyranopterin monophosphate synthase MoaC [Pseudoflavonifractor sp. 60]NBI68251.1 cyclic pyranopterin monophosphate synthase MoaC [Pseudoflavonifractor sp. 60]
MEPVFNHFDARGNAVMVDVSEKASTSRTVVAQGSISVCPEVFQAITEGTAAKGDVLGVARVAGIMAAKNTAGLIPLCHPLALSHLAVDFTCKAETHTIQARCTARTTGQTGVEMEALTGVSAALLTIYDMCKAMDRGMVLSEIRLVYKDGGKSGVFSQEETP